MAPPNTFLRTADGQRRRRTSNVRLPLELGSDRRETSATRVSDDLQISIFRRRKFFFRKKFQTFFGFSLFLVDFRGARLFLTSKSSSSRFFALDGQIFRSVRPLGLIFRFFTVRTSTSNLLSPVRPSVRPSSVRPFKKTSNLLSPVRPSKGSIHKT